MLKVCQYRHSRQVGSNTVVVVVVVVVVDLLSLPG